MSYAKQLIKNYQRSQRIKLLKEIAYHLAEFLTAVAIFGFGYLWFLIMS